GQGRSLEKKIEVEPFKRDIADETEIEPWRGAQLKRMAVQVVDFPVPVPVFIPVIAGKGSAAHIDRALPDVFPGFVSSVALQAPPDILETVVLIVSPIAPGTAVGPPFHIQGFNAGIGHNAGQVIEYISYFVPVGNLQVIPVGHVAIQVLLRESGPDYGGNAAAPLGQQAFPPAVEIIDGNT